MNLIVIDNKAYKSDFRKYLLRAARAAGGTALHVRWWDDVFITADEKICDIVSSCDPSDELARVVANLSGPGPAMVLLGLGMDLSAVAFVRALRKTLPQARFAYDVYDYFRYGATGKQLYKLLKQDLAWRREADFSMLLDKGLQKLYPFARHLDNASNAPFCESSAKADPRRLVYIGSIDSRVDFDLLDQLASRPIEIDLWGKVHEGDPAVAATLYPFIERHPNVTFKGPYDNDALGEILGQYRIGLVPYKTNCTLTDHINPDKVYHFLNAGLEVIATPIPQVRRLGQYVHLISSAAEFDAAYAQAQTAPRQALWPREAYTWGRRWEQLSSFT